MRGLDDLDPPSVIIVARDPGAAADREGYQTDIIPDRSEPTSDALQISPDSGTYHWLEDIRANSTIAWGRDVVSFKLLSTTPTRVELVLNDSIRIDHAGKYSAKVTTRRVRPFISRLEYAPSILLTTNEVTFDVEEMTDADEAKEATRLMDEKKKLESGIKAAAAAATSRSRASTSGPRRT
jgi:hypothetical protein